jgi:hypothetical protein
VTDGDPESRSQSNAQSGDPSVEHPGKKYERIANKYGEPVDADEFEIMPEEPPIPDRPVHGDSNAPAKLQASFWALVLVFNAALLGVSLGAMFIVFEGNWTLGPQLLIGGVLVFGFGLYRYRQIKRKLDEGELQESGDHNG